MYSDNKGSVRAALFAAMQMRTVGPCSLQNRLQQHHAVHTPVYKAHISCHVCRVCKKECITVLVLACYLQDPSLSEALFYMNLYNLVSADGPSAVVAATTPLKENFRQLVSALGECLALRCTV